jgi:hypothetical protein
LIYRNADQVLANIFFESEESGMTDNMHLIDRTVWPMNSLVGVSACPVKRAG